MDKLVEAVLPLLPFLTQVLAYLPTVAVAAPLIAVLIDGGKKLGFVKDGTAQLWSLALNGLTLGVLAAFKLQEAQVADVFAALASLAPALLALYLALKASADTHGYSIYGGTGFGYSYAIEKRKADDEAVG